MIEVRTPRAGDEPAIRVLLQQLGYTASVDELKARLAVLAQRATDPILVAADDERLVGLVALHWTPMLFAAAPVARITTLVVDEAARGKGIGRRLVDAGAELARDAGCAVLELTTGLGRSDAQAFYESIGFTATSIRLHRPLT